ncbi:UNVERIFIED_CONTAM: 3,9-dihydroxypterocarpan 6A-monooxygenase [Sesamum radiatum]|uniref:3,9-dihydroxypterocarpan 6A-monooxygenase n=1 Tax=Sesamum radiatum TaxID=300843 RepID=A0AAW2NAU0_SESRA
MAEIQEYIVILLIWLIPIILLRAFVKKRSSRRLPPGPLALPIIGHLHLLSSIPHQAFYKISSRYGPLIHLYLGSVPCIVASSPEICKEFLKTHEISFSNRPKTVVSDYVTYGSQDFSFAPYGDHWKFVKKLCVSRLLGGQTLDLQQPIRRQEINYLIELLSMKAKAGESVAIGSELIRMSNNVISRMVLSRRLSENENEAAEIREQVREITALTGQFNLSDFIWFCKNLDVQGFGKRLKSVMGRFDKMMEKIIEEHQSERRKLKQRSNEGEAAKDLLHIMLDIAEDESSEMKLTRENIKGFILDLFIAATDTSALAMEWGLSELINHPNIMRKAAQEIDSVVGNNRIVQESDIPHLPYLQAIVKEILRLHPPAPLIPRESTEDCTISGYHIPAKTRVFISIWAVGRDPNYWEDPLEFRPERFLPKDGSAKGQLDVRGQNFHFLPFGSGRRGCPGTSLALLLVQTTLAAMIQCFEWKVEGGNGTVDMEEGPGLTLPKAHHLVCSPVVRLNPVPPM